MKTLSIATIATFVAFPAVAETARHADSHEHGVGQLNIAFEGTKMAIELHAPGADIVGFEYHAESQEDRDAVDAAVELLAKPMGLFTLPAEAGCQVVQASAELEGDDEHDHEHDDHKDEHDHDHEADHKDHDDHKEDTHDDHEEHAESHTEFHAEYVFECAKLDAVATISFPYFEAFPNAQELELQAVSEKGAAAFEIERDEPSVNLSGLF